MLFPIMLKHVQYLILVMCTEHQLTCDWQTFIIAVGVFTFYQLMYLNTKGAYSADKVR